MKVVAWSQISVSECKIIHSCKNHYSYKSWKKISYLSVTVLHVVETRLVPTYMFSYVRTARKLGGKMEGHGVRGRWREVAMGLEGDGERWL